MNIFFIRHFESVKNTSTSFSSLYDNEELTEKGIAQGEYIALCIKKFLELKQLKVKNIYCAKSVRAEHTARIIASTLSSSVKVLSFSDLLSSKSKELMGKTREVAIKINPQFIHELSLYDAGIFNAYNFCRDNAKSTKVGYEKQVIACLNSIIDNECEEDTKIIILHNSSITAAVIHYARKIFNYPKNYYGKINADNGKIFWIQDDKFLAANIDCEMLLNINEGEIDVT